MHVSAVTAPALPATPLTSGKSKLVPPGVARRELDLPPGIQKKAEGTLPPGIDKRFSGAAPVPDGPLETPVGSQPDNASTLPLDILV